MKKLTILAAGLIATLLPNASHADCPDAAVKCMAVTDSNPNPVLVYMANVNFKSVKLDTSSAGKFFSSVAAGLADKGFQCHPCITGCGDGVNKAIEKCDEAAKSKGYVAGYLDPNDLQGPSINSVVTDILATAKNAAETAGEVKRAKNG